MFYILLIIYLASIILVVIMMNWAKKIEPDHAVWWYGSFAYIVAFIPVINTGLGFMCLHLFLKDIIENKD